MVHISISDNSSVGGDLEGFSVTSKLSQLCSEISQGASSIANSVSSVGGSVYESIKPSAKYLLGCGVLGVKVFLDVINFLIVSFGIVVPGTAIAGAIGGIAGFFLGGLAGPIGALIGGGAGFVLGTATVALPMVKIGVDTGEYIQRFYREQLQDYADSLMGNLRIHPLDDAFKPRGFRSTDSQSR